MSKFIDPGSILNLFCESNSDMSHTLENLKKARYIVEAVPLMAGGYLAVFRVHLRGRPESDDDVYLGDEHADAISAINDAASLAAQYLGTRGEW